MRSKNTSKILIILVAIVLLSCGEQKPAHLLPIYGAKKLGNTDTIYHTIGDFSFRDQYGETVDNNTVKGKIYVADFFFATCQSICPEKRKGIRSLPSALLFVVRIHHFQHIQCLIGAETFRLYLLILVKDINHRG